MAGGLEQALGEELHTHPDGQAAADDQIGGPRRRHRRVIGGQAEKEGRTQQGEGQEQQPAQPIEQKAVTGHPVGLLLLPGPQALGKQGVEAHPGSGAEGHHHQLDRIGIGEGQKVQLAHLGHIDAVHQVIDGAHQHGEHDWGGHGPHQLGDRKGPQNIVGRPTHPASPSPKCGPLERPRSSVSIMSAAPFDLGSE